MSANNIPALKVSGATAITNSESTAIVDDASGRVRAYMTQGLIDPATRLDLDSPLPRLRGPPPQTRSRSRARPRGPRRRLSQSRFVSEDLVEDLGGDGVDFDGRDDVACARDLFVRVSEQA